MRFTIFLVLVLLGAFTGTALAADVGAASDSSLADMTRMIFDAVTHGQWWAVAAYGVVLACIGARKFMPDSWKAGVKGDAIGMVLAFALAFAGGIANWAIAPGAVMTAAVLLTATKIGIAAIGGYTVIHKLLGWLVAWGKLPAWATPVLKLLAMLVGSNAIAKAEAAGEAAAKAHPPAGMTGTAKITEVE